MDSNFQSYISENLIHFVGSGLEKDSCRYSLLKRLGKIELAVVFPACH